MTVAGYDDLVSTAMHELTHVLVFSSSLFPYFRDESGEARTPRDSWGDPADAFYSYALSRSISSAATISYASERGMDCSWGTASSWASANIPYGLLSKDPSNCVARLSTPRVKAASRAFYDCNLLEGAELENQDTSSGFVQGSHWEARTLAGEYMAAYSFPGAKISAITLAAFEDSGWYTAAYMNGDKWVKGKDWGYKQGCAFALDKCSATNTGSPAHFYFGSPDISGSLCSVDRSTSAYTETTVYPTPLPLQYRYFSSSSKGGSSARFDYCPAVTGYSSSSWLCKSTTPSTLYGEVASAGSKCHVSTLNKYSSSPSASSGMCYRVTCASNGQSYALAAGSGATATCATEGAVATFSGYGGSVVCGSPAALCGAGEAWVPPCAAGSALDAAISACSPCIEGSYALASNTTSACTPCTPGLYAALPAQAACAACPAGSWCGAGTAQPTPCPSGTWGAAGRPDSSGCLCFSAQCYSLRYPAQRGRGGAAHLSLPKSPASACCAALAKAAGAGHPPPWPDWHEPHRRRCCVWR